MPTPEVDLNIPQTPQGITNQELFDQMLLVYNALQQLKRKIDEIEARLQAAAIP